MEVKQTEKYAIQTDLMAPKILNSAVDFRGLDIKRLLIITQNLKVQWNGEVQDKIIYTTFVTFVQNELLFVVIRAVHWMRSLN